MKLAVIGSRSIAIQNLDEYLPSGITEIVSGGAVGVDEAAARYANEKGIKLVEFLPEYTRYKRAAPLKRNEKIADYADAAIAFWDGSSRGTEYTIKLFQKRGKPVTVIIKNNPPRRISWTHTRSDVTINSHRTILCSIAYVCANLVDLIIYINKKLQRNFPLQFFLIQNNHLI